MDKGTLAAYDSDAARFAQDWHDQPAPSDLHALVRRFFTSGPTADIGCGSGREIAWLNEEGFPAIGYDASAGLLAEARARYPGLDFRIATLPDLAEIADSFDNVLCETVIMHLDRAAIAPSVRRLFSLLKPGGTLYLSWRVTEGADLRDAQGRLYASFDGEKVRRELPAGTILLDEDIVSASSGKRVHRIVARRQGEASLTPAQLTPARLTPAP
jgi:2-polyprenyl-3-methyl-5-hydroxy-6-metoxy-1,4-benzoquinol methylase